MSTELNARAPLPSIVRSHARAAWGGFDRCMASAMQGLAALLPSKSGEGWTSGPQLAETTLRSERWCREGLKRLEATGVVVWTRGGIVEGRAAPSWVRVDKKAYLALIADAKQARPRRRSAPIPAEKPETESEVVEVTVPEPEEETPEAEPETESEVVEVTVPEPEEETPEAEPETESEVVEVTVPEPETERPPEPWDLASEWNPAMLEEYVATGRVMTREWHGVTIARFNPSWTTWARPPRWAVPEKPQPDPEAVRAASLAALERLMAEEASA